MNGRLHSRVNSLPLYMILIAPDKFKGTFTAAEAADIIAGVISPAIGLPVLCHPVADGGEDSQIIALRAPLATPFAGVWTDAASPDVCVISSQVVGPGCYPADMPLARRSSRALGRAIAHAAGICRGRLFVAVGGTQCCDAGAGMLAALGARFFDDAGNAISGDICPATLGRVATADLSGITVPASLTAVCDVRASLTSPPLSALDFVAQKALPGEDLSLFRSALDSFGSLFPDRSPFDGAGGGIGFALCSVLHSQAGAGAELAADRIDWDSVSLLITGEGCLDRQTTGGKTVDILCRRARRHGIPAVIIAGTRRGTLPYPHVFTADTAAGATRAGKLASAAREALPLIIRLLKNKE